MCVYLFIDICFSMYKLFFFFYTELLPSMDGCCDLTEEEEEEALNGDCVILLEIVPSKSKLTAFLFWQRPWQSLSSPSDKLSWGISSKRYLFLFERERGERENEIVKPD